MLKSGEEYRCSPTDDLQNLQTTYKPRGIKVPSDNLCGVFTAIQSTFWEPIKKVIPGFI